MSTKLSKKPSKFPTSQPCRLSRKPSLRHIHVMSSRACSLSMCRPPGHFAPAYGILSQYTAIRVGRFRVDQEAIVPAVSPPGIAPIYEATSVTDAINRYSSYVQAAPSTCAPIYIHTTEADNAAYQTIKVDIITSATPASASVSKLSKYPFWCLLQAFNGEN